MFRWFESIIDPFRPYEVKKPPDGLIAFYWSFLRQVWPVYIALMATGLVVALLEVSLFRYIGEVVDILRNATPERLWADHGTDFLWMAAVIVVARPLATVFHDLMRHQAIAPGFTNLVRWQNHRWVLRQSIGFFANDFAGRIANRIVQTGPALRGSLTEAADAVWFVMMYTISAIVLFFDADVRLAVPMIVWVGIYILALTYFVPRVARKSAEMSEARSMLSGRIVDSYTNMPTVKLFAHSDREDAYARDALTEHTAVFHEQMRAITQMTITVGMLNAVLLFSIGATAVWLWTAGSITIGAIALASGLVIRVVNMSGWIMWEITGIFENVGQVQDGITTISRPHQVVDVPDAPQLVVTDSEIHFDHVRFHYGRDKGAVEDVSLVVKPGEKIGLVGPSGAGKSTLVNLLLRFYDLEGGMITIDGQDISKVQQESLRETIAVVTQDTSLLHRSIRANIKYGRPDASDEEMFEAARLASADAFIPDLVDTRGGTAYDAQTGERGVKLSGGQRQRIAIARVLLKNAPILVLDEATSALDSEVEAAIQESLETLMEGKTVIAIAHRLSTIARMDRLVIMDKGRIVETGTHEELLARGGLYARLWARQTGGFVTDEDEQEMAAE
ncbi:putative multidrug export ATP-binding/permease protein [Hartmannibacter diazotrophicus]|uniref:Putative multidrug export ATP-binding/permease protein n=1 Tax=Hartmannibacter diazotrophicus TaxID=1482074 RepID=A0A2C9DAB7_9HYPH|nr:ABC transporter ATP-binding protein [Hartmannibacter diazotrophicus]SON56545.1 putative multidrug export ATP-binding/permease protein [Hartmannibacter diazotrophicus]